MSDAESAQDPEPLRTWRPMALWTAALLLVLGLIWFIGAAAVPVWRVHRAIAEYRDRNGCASGSFLPGRPGAAALKARLGDGDAGLSQLRLFLKCPRMERRWIAIELLASYGGQAAPDLIDELWKGTTVTTAEGIMLAYSSEGGSARQGLVVLGADALPAIRRRLADGHGFRKVLLLEVLAMMKAEASSVLPELMDIAQHSPDVIAAIFAVEAMSGIGESAAPQLRELLSDPAPEVSEVAALLLLSLRWDQSPEVLRIVEDGSKRNGLTREACLEALAIHSRPRPE